MARPRRLHDGGWYEARFIGGAIGPKGPAGLPIRPQASFVGYSVLDDERLDPSGWAKAMRKPTGAVILHVKRVPREVPALR